MEKWRINVDLELLPEDFRELTETAGRQGMTTAELLEAFIADLTLSDLSHGADERDNARAWLDRCGFSYISNAGDSFLTWLIDTGDYTLYHLYRNKILYFENVKQELTPADLEELQESREELDRLYKQYCEDTNKIELQADAFRNADRWTNERYYLQGEAKVINTDY